MRFVSHSGCLALVVAVGFSSAAAANPFSGEVNSERMQELMMRLDRLEMMVEDNARNLRDDAFRSNGQSGTPGSRTPNPESGASEEWADATPLGLINEHYYISDQGVMVKVSADIYKSVLEAYERTPPQRSESSADTGDGESTDGLSVAPEQ